MTRTSLDVTGRDCLSFTVSGPWAHFRRLDTTTEKLTYRVIPRTTAAGLVAAVLGEPRDSYYDTFAPEVSAMAITPLSSLETMPIPQLTLPTEEGDIQTADGVSGKTVVDPGTIATERKRRTFEYIVDPAYRIDLVLDDDAVFERVAEQLLAGRATYTPYLGKSECLATIDDVERTTVTDTDATSVHSTVPEEHVVPGAGKQLRIERTPAYMKADETGRRTTGFVSYAYSGGDETLTVSDAPTKEVEDRTVCFI
ncbi:type I-B CRISPR-associated protein Cas5b [Halomicrobium sp. LC1Hm]|uniref:type I-B CRISPR-associated protein Cas5b n=1 Tax=Halomicrobium sp. LC1Hm TaxID=2610902 RepID=UPI0012983E83|nr:type I-B CRISPR-associated protein Cas5b [Halomicrobium sp. LC1Hm]QGA82158.1 CRISPR-Cas system related protein Cas5 [Halomicrobium sp. LC1Hm]